MVLPEIATTPGSARGGRKEPKSQNGSIKRLHEFFARIVRESGSNANLTLMRVAKRLTTSNRNRPPVKVSKIAEELGSSGKTALVVAKILDDECVVELPAMKIVALKWSRGAQEKVEEWGGRMYTLDQFLADGRTMNDLMLIQGDPNARKASKFFGPAPGERNSRTCPRQTHKGKNREKRLNVPKTPVYDEDSE